jgi:hypothetical protein
MRDVTAGGTNLPSSLLSRHRRRLLPFLSLALSLAVEVEWAKKVGTNDNDPEKK